MLNLLIVEDNDRLQRGLKAGLEATGQVRVTGAVTSGEEAVAHCLDAAPDALPIILDWVLHVWLFFIPYELRLSGVLLQAAARDQLVLWVPVRAAPPGR